jgi:hypothetical protein
MLADLKLKRQNGDFIAVSVNLTRYNADSGVDIHVKRRKRGRGHWEEVHYADALTAAELTLAVDNALADLAVQSKRIINRHHLRNMKTK